MTGAVADAELIRAAVLGCPEFADLSAGPFGEIASYLPGGPVAGVRVDDERVEVHIVAHHGPALRDVADAIGRALAPLLAGRPLTVAVDDLLLPGEAPGAESGAARPVE